MGIKTSKEKNKRIDKLNKCKIHETKISAYTPVPFPFPAVSKANKRSLSLSRVRLGSPFTTSLYLSIPERSLRNKRTRSKICRNVQVVES